MKYTTSVYASGLDHALAKVYHILNKEYSMFSADINLISVNVRDSEERFEYTFKVEVNGDPIMRKIA